MGLSDHIDKNWKIFASLKKKNKLNPIGFITSQLKEMKNEDSILLDGLEML